MTSRDDVLKRAAVEISRDRAWRAREILRGAIGSAHVDPAILEAYGHLLDSMGDRLEAGKYLFLSGAREPQYADAIALFLQRHRNRDVSSLIGLFPAAVRRLPFDQLPATVRAELEARGAAPELFPGRSPDGSAQRLRVTWRDRAAGVAAMAVFVVFVAALGIGVVTLTRWAFQLLAGR